MRTDVKVGLVCVFAVVLGVVCYFTLHDKNNVSTANVPSAVSPHNSGATTAPSVASADRSTPPVLAPGGSILGPSRAYGQMTPTTPPNDMGPTVILPPGAATNPSMSNGSGSLTPPGSMNQPLIPTPGLSAPGTLTPSTGLSTAPLLPGDSSSPTTGPTVSILPSSSPFSSFPTTPTPTPKSAKGGRSKPSTISVMDQTPSNNVDIMGGSATGSTYTIQSGDTLGALAKRNGVSVKAILAANPGVDPNRLKVNQKVNIPAAGATPTSRPANTKGTATTRSSSKKKPKSATTQPGVAGGSYTVKKGDTLRKIAKATYGDESLWRRIFRANRGDMANPNDLTVGQIIKLPATK